MSAGAWLALVVLGGGGAVLRYAVGNWVERAARTRFPVGTFAINIGGAFALGILAGAHASDTVLFIAGTGLIGSFTTFSTWMFETQRLAEGGARRVAAWNVGLSLGAGLAAAGLGWALAAGL